MRKLIMAIAVMSLAGTSFAAVENIKVSGGISAEAIMRDLGLSRDIQDNDDEFLISQISLRFDADLTEGVSAVLRLLSQETWGEDNADDMEIDLGYIELKEFLYQPLTLIVGKQNLRYGSGLVVGDPDTNQGNPNDPVTGLPAVATDLSMRKSFDAVKAILDFAPWTVDLVFAQIDENTTAARWDDEQLYGLNAAYDWSSYNGVTELYLFGGNKAPRSAVTIATNSYEDYVGVIGSRVQFDPNDNWTLGLEGAYQFGKFYASFADQDSINAYAGILNVDYRFLNDYNAKLGFKYTHLSGDNTATDGTHEGWQEMWEDQSPGGELTNIFMDNTNARIITLTGSVMPREDITLGALYSVALVDKKYAATYSPTMGPASANTYVTNDSKMFGQEVDIYAIYDYTEDVQLKVSSAYFNPGELFNQNNHLSAMSVRAGVNVDF
jgi:hypothetical protein